MHNLGTAAGEGNRRKFNSLVFNGLSQRVNYMISNDGPGTPIQHHPSLPLEGNSSVRMTFFKQHCGWGQSLPLGCCKEICYRACTFVESPELICQPPEAVRVFIAANTHELRKTVVRVGLQSKAKVKARTLLRRLEQQSTISKAPALTAWKPRVVVCASGCIVHT